MAALQNSTLEAIGSNQAQLLSEWHASLEANGATRNIREQDLRQETREFLQLVVDGLRNESGTNIAAEGWEETRRFLEKLSASRAQVGQESHQTAFFIFALKGPLFNLLQTHYREQPALLAEQLWEISSLFDAFGLHTIRTYQKNREAVIKRQQEELLELSTPVVKLWEGVLALPLIGTLDSHRSQTVMESLLQRIVDTGSEIAIIDITGVPTVDTLVAQHLLKTVTAIRLMGADCIISGVRPQIAQTIVHLGLDLGTLTTKSNLADALKLALARLGTAAGERG
ncbi:STAS domain-containing protein [Pseudomonas kermanshahensis]|jgi:Anti-anti-sigma regulatory factor (antagonist of anti-sigma factor)|uniref:STAS domain-containing protein n=1 Tax=Pseudomonas kermanshahensis TaxID=2745482 RepID=A0ABU8R3A5_9PSED|nr:MULTISPECIES: STAS domain-containing protein [Pseudomonas]MBC3497111.1 STAS domain-containing protein [Pseudomonas sp. SWRI67]MBV4527400.1 STAS domain-containing protein [Pseudomonas kermanshahensis]